MNNYKDYFRGKKITQMGLGLLGRGVGDALFLSECGAEIIVTDLKNEEELKDSVEKLKGAAGITLHLGGHKLEDFKDRDMILKSAGVPLDSEFIAEARENNIPIEMGAALFCKLGGAVTIGVTGTRGKSTTTHLIEHILKTAGKSTLLGGNVRAVATLPMLKDIKPGDIAVLELDSWQLQGFGDSKISPHVAVFTTFMDDHMNYYGGDRAKYFADKANIYAFQKKGDTLVVGEEIAQVIMQKKQGEGDIVVAHRESVPKDWDIKIPGEHNLLNIACVIEAAKSVGIAEADIRAGVESFIGVEGRLQFVKEFKGVKIYNDNNATTPDATIAGLAALPLGHTVLIAGGADKNLPLDTLSREINEHCKLLVLIPGNGTERLKKEGVVTIKTIEAADLSEAVVKALAETAPGDSLLFSPAFTSFSAYKNEYERNDHFMKIITELQ